MPTRSLGVVPGSIGAIACLLGAAACGDSGVRDAPRRTAGSSRECVRRSAHDVDVGTRERLGFAPEDVLPYALGVHDAPIAWRALAQATHAATSEGTSVSLAVARAEGPLTEVQFEDNAWEACAPLLEVPVEVSVRSSDGALDERIRTTLSASYVGAASLRHTFDLTRLRGKLALRTLPSAERAIVAITLSAVITPASLSGAIWPQYVDQLEDPDANVAAERLARIGP